MKMNAIIDIQETSPNHWRAKYQGNYGIYTIKITFDQKGQTSDFSCSCPSDYYPCKHIPIVKEAIAERIAENHRSADAGEKLLTVEELLKNVSLQELRNFIVRQAKYNSDLTNAVRLEFAHRITGETSNPYSAILRDILKKTDFDYEDYYEYEEGLSLDGLDLWLEKAQAYAEQKNYREAVLICKACIEEFAEWRQNADADADVDDYINESYQSTPFEVMEKTLASPDVDSKALFEYCLSEMEKDKYSGTEMFDSFNDLLAVLAAQTNPDRFIALQDSLLKKIKDKSSYEAEKILKRKINFYSNTQQPEKADELIEKNIQIENFRYQVAQKRFAEQNLAEAKKLTKDFLLKDPHAGRNYGSRWDELLLEIAQKEKDIPSIRAIAFSFINRNFDKKYFGIYKSTFAPDEWRDALENLLQHYEKDRRGFSSAAADVLVAEGAAERLMQYVAKNLSVEIVERYHRAFAASFPEKTLEMFAKVTDEYAAKNIGRTHYEYIARLLQQIRKIKGGDRTAADMISRYRIKYKNRRAMMEILNKV
jgi:hypothetical protein